MFGANGDFYPKELIEDSGLTSLIKRYSNKTEVQNEIIEGALAPSVDLLFQDTAGNTPASAAGDPIGLVKDQTSNGNDATQSTASKKPVLQDDGSVIAALFDGADDGLNLSSGAVNTALNGSTWSVGGWVRIKAIGTNEVLWGEKSAANQRIIGSRWSSVGLDMVEEAVAELDTEVDLTTNVWTHVMWTYDGTTVRAYKDGTQVSSFDYNFQGTSNVAYKLVDSSQPQNIDISDWQVWDTARTQTEIQNNKDVQLNGDENGLVGYWILGNKTGPLSTGGGGTGSLAARIKPQSLEIAGEIIEE